MRYGPANCTFEKATGPSNAPLGGQGEGSFQVPRNTRSLYGWHAVRSAREHRRACWAVPNGAPYGMRRARPFQPTDTKVMFAVRYDDGQSAYIRVTPEAARYGHLVVLSIAREQQKAGDIPDGLIVSVQQVR